MSMVPLNLGAEAPFRLKLHLEQCCAVSGFWVPQFGQNTPPPPNACGLSRDAALQSRHSKNATRGLRHAESAARPPYGSPVAAHRAHFEECRAPHSASSFLVRVLLPLVSLAGASLQVRCGHLPGTLQREGILDRRKAQWSIPGGRSSAQVILCRPRAPSLLAGPGSVSETVGGGGARRGAGPRARRRREASRRSADFIRIRARPCSRGRGGTSANAEAQQESGGATA